MMKTRYCVAGIRHEDYDANDDEGDGCDTDDAPYERGIGGLSDEEEPSDT